MREQGRPEYLFAQCAVTSCKYHAEKARGQCIAQHTMTPSVAEIGYYKNMPKTDLTRARNTAKETTTRLLLLTNYAQFCYNTNALPDSQLLHDQLHFVLTREPYNDPLIGMKVSASTLAAMLLQSTYEQFIEQHNLAICEKLRLHRLLFIPLGECTALQNLLRTHSPELSPAHTTITGE